jgi:hypothetical protein
MLSFEPRFEPSSTTKKHLQRCQIEQINQRDGVVS